MLKANAYPHKTYPPAIEYKIILLNNYNDYNDSNVRVYKGMIVNSMYTLTNEH